MRRGLWSRSVLAKLPGFPDALLSLAAAELAAGATDSAQLLILQVLNNPRAGCGREGTRQRLARGRAGCRGTLPGGLRGVCGLQ